MIHDDMTADVPGHYRGILAYYFMSRHDIISCHAMLTPIPMACFYNFDVLSSIWQRLLICWEHSRYALGSHMTNFQKIVLNVNMAMLVLSSKSWSKLSTNMWWCHQMETFSALLATGAGNSPGPGEFPTQRPVTRSFDVFFDLRPNKRLGKQSWGWWFEMPSRPLWRHRNDLAIASMCYRRNEMEESSHLTISNAPPLNRLIVVHISSKFPAKLKI